MKEVGYITPDGIAVSVPEADAAHFDAKGWKRSDGSSPKTYADMSMKELKATLADRGIEADGKKEDLIAALEAADESNK